MAHRRPELSAAAVLKRLAGPLAVSVSMVAMLSAAAPAASAEQRVGRVAVFPVENLTGAIAPGEEIRRAVIERLVAAGIAVLADVPLNDFLARHRVRYVAGIDGPTAESLQRETGVQGVVIVTMDLSIESPPPKVALLARFVSLDGGPAVTWADDAAVAGDDRPGLFELGLENDYQKVLANAVTPVADSLVRFLSTGERTRRRGPASKFRPTSVFRGLTLQPDREYTIAVVPFMNSTERRSVGELLALLCMRHLAGAPQFRVVDAGAVRRQLLDARIIMDGGLSLADADTVATLIDADFVLAGQVFRYEDHEGAGAATGVEFSTMVIERSSRKIVWKSRSYNEGMDGVRFFERGASRTAHIMATQMVRLTIQQIAGEDR